jgi:hypothetical protein
MACPRDQILLYLSRSSLITGFSNLATEATFLEEGPVK